MSDEVEKRRTKNKNRVAYTYFEKIKLSEILKISNFF